MKLITCLSQEQFDEYDWHMTSRLIRSGLYHFLYSPIKAKSKYFKSRDDFRNRITGVQRTVCLIEGSYLSAGVNLLYSTASANMADKLG